MINLIINNIKVQVPTGSTILQACSLVGIEVPRFCYHEKLSIAGNCRMCLVEVGKSLKPVASCAMPISENMVVNTNTVLVKKAREGVLEFLLANHPLDCPICDQGGECDLQDQSMVFGSDRGRFYEYKRAVEDKNFGPLVKTVMTRCIHCTRCVRFSTEIAGVSALGTTGRGAHTEIGSYIQKLFDSELSGNVVDLCPVGALTSKPYAFTARSWELKSVETFDVFDPIVPSIRVDVRGPEIMRILPRLNESVNEEWISDKTRFFYDGLKRQRLTLPLIKYPLFKFTTKTSSCVFIPFSWESVLKWVSFFFNLHLYSRQSFSSSIIPVLGEGLDYLTVFSMKKFFASMGIKKYILNNNKIPSNVDFRNFYSFSQPYNNLKQYDALVLVGVNFRLESPVLNARIKNLVSHNGLEVFSLGSPSNLTYKSFNISNKTSCLFNILAGKHPLSSYFSDKKVLFIFGNAAFETIEFSFFCNLKFAFPKKNFAFEYFNNNASLYSAFDLGLKDYNSAFKSHSKMPNLFYVLSADNLDINFSEKDLIIYQGHHGDRIASYSHIILPTPAFTERTAFFPNAQGFFNRTNKVLNSVAMARLDFRILQSLFLTIFKQKVSKFNISSFFYNKNIPPLFLSGRYTMIQIQPVNSSLFCVVKNLNFSSLISNFYRSDLISRASLTMSLSSKSFLTNYFWRK